MTRCDNFELTEGSDGLLHFFVRYEAVNLMRSCLQNNPSLVNSRDKRSGSTPLHVACQLGTDLGVVQVLLDHGADVDALDDDGNTALILATTFDASIETVNMLLARGADVSLRNSDGESAMSAAMVYDRLDVVSVLAERESDLTSRRWTALHEAVQHNDVNILRLVLAKTATVDVQTPDGLTALHLAVRDVSRSLVPVLLEYGDLEVADDQGRTPLLTACQTAPLQTIQLLVSSRANVHVKDAKGSTALMYAITNPQAIDVIQLLLQVGADPGVANADGQTAHSMALQSYPRGHRVRRGVENALFRAGHARSRAPD